MAKRRLSRSKANVARRKAYAKAKRAAARAKKAAPKKTKPKKSRPKKAKVAARHPLEDALERAYDLQDQLGRGRYGEARVVFIEDGRRGTKKFPRKHWKRWTLEGFKKFVKEEKYRGARNEFGSGRFVFALKGAESDRFEDMTEKETIHRGEF